MILKLNLRCKDVVLDQAPEFPCVNAWEDLGQA